jgi:N-methylhydantoinase B/oxoprolinase/acetone carboxylase alpha subunit/acetone carboxylase gamma subunit
MAELDPIKYEIFYQRMDKMLNEAKEVVRYLSAGMITREAGEVQEAFYLPNGESALIAAGILMHIMNVTRVIRYMTDNKYTSEDVGIYEGDQFINNDAYIGGMHCQDTAVVSPFFYKGQHLGFTAAISHTSDVGAIESAGTCPSARESVHDGVHLNAVKLVERGLLRRDVFGMILRAVRDSNYVELDIRARMAGNDRATNRLTELVEEVGPEFYTAACKKMIDDAEAFARDRIKTLKPGIYRARVFDDCGMLIQGEIKEQLATVEVEIEITKEGDFLVRVPVVSPENGGFNNAYIPAIEATVFYTLLDLLMYDCRWNSGFARAIKVQFCPDKSRLSASPNRSVNYASIGIGSVFCNVLTDAISRAAYVSGRSKDVAGGATVTNSGGLGGLSQWGRLVVQTVVSNPIAAGMGALLDHDGIDSSVTMYNPWSYVGDVEGEELAMPIIHLTRNHRPDSGGFGKFRGGCGVTHVTMIHNSPGIGLTKYGMGNKLPTNQGLFGGYPGAASFFDLFQDTNIYEQIAEGAPLPFTWEDVTKLLQIKGKTLGHCSGTEKILKSGDIWNSTSHGGGAGVGDPIERDPVLIAQDIENKMTTWEVASSVYAVVIDPKTLKVDHAKTTALRAGRKKERLQKGIPGIKYLENLVKTREQKQLPGFILNFLAETAKFCPAFEKEMAREKEIVAKGLKSPPDKIAASKKIVGITPYVDIVADKEGKKYAVCSQCGHVHCEANDNFKLHCLIYDRPSDDYHLGRLAYDKEWCVMREFYCPSCASQVEVEAVPPGMPILWNYELKL